MKKAVRLYKEFIKESEDFSETEDDIISLSYDEYFILLNHFIDSGDDKSITYLLNSYKSLLKWYHRIFNIKLKSIQIELCIIKAETISKLFSDKINTKLKYKFYKNPIIHAITPSESPDISKLHRIDGCYYKSGNYVTSFYFRT